MKNTGRGLEMFVQRIYETLKGHPDVKVLQNVKLPNSISGESQFDVILKFKIAGSDIIVAIECKDYKDRVSISEIHDFEGRCNLVKGIGRKIFVAANGYQAGAKKVSKQKYDIELYEIEKISKDTLQNWFVPERLKIANLVDRKALLISFFGTNGQIIDVPANELSPSTPIFEPGRKPYPLGVVLYDIAEKSDKSGFTKEWLDKLFENKSIWDTNEKNLILSTNLNFNMSGRPFAIIVNNHYFPLEKIVVELEYKFELLSPSNLNARGYRKESDKENLAEIISGNLRDWKFDLITSKVDGVTKLFVQNLDGEYFEVQE